MQENPAPSPGEEKPAAHERMFCGKPARSQRRLPALGILAVDFSSFYARRKDAFSAGEGGRLLQRGN
ncbi:hypothetical protein CgunFtcFv8_015880 [Champsocephalus gunnari]|uniref:Uncharacterized protein n=1 Tax=Champsocephalus gunnari TaxID=52237 RepID=A0AAN8C786_CHAGU|nr:hypothetical protein CgunFtcFv8_015880 [Champsocephalus gunnari]